MRWLARMADLLFNRYKVTRFNFVGFECERLDRWTGKYQHRHYTDHSWKWRLGQNPYRNNIKERDDG